MSELRWYCTVWRKKSKKIKVNMEKIWVVHSIELHQLYINQVFSQLSGFSFRKKQKKNRVFYVILLDILMQKKSVGTFFE